MLTSLKRKIGSLGSLLVTLHGSVGKHWLHRGEDKRGAGWRKAARKWTVGESLKQNASLIPPGGPKEAIVAVFSGSQLRPIVEKETQVPSSWYVNCTPGGTFLDIALELEVAATAHALSPDYVVLAVGTNDAGRHMAMERAERHLRQLLYSATKNFPCAKILIPSIPPRLDEFDHRLGMYNAMISRVVTEVGLHHVDISRAFNNRNSMLWSSRDSVHLSTNYGVPLFIKTIRRALNSISPSVNRKIDSESSLPLQSVNGNGKQFMAWGRQIDNIVIKHKCFLYSDVVTFHNPYLLILLLQSIPYY